MKIDKEESVLFLSGPMTGIKGYNFPLFNSCANALRNKGYKVINPAELPTHEDWTWEAYMRRSLTLLMNSSAIVLLPRAYNSRGAREEIHLAGVIDTPIFTITDFLTKEEIQEGNVNDK